ncbi:hypothetical protein BpHYR1_042352 [Brachionus plicatilis]|uniref:Uncharacterized protein n=1 Tax=Brachionus plicatilis TaxID=10195 RepID=A0A3M7SUQ1_BRAPC|nr:hypothetical protein BpHYR1_042352 [Brachionus plicatilis]
MYESELFPNLYMRQVFKVNGHVLLNEYFALIYDLGLHISFRSILLLDSLKVIINNFLLLLGGVGKLKVGINQIGRLGRLNGRGRADWRYDFIRTACQNFTLPYAEHLTYALGEFGFYAFVALTLVQWIAWIVYIVALMICNIGINDFSLDLLINI